MTNGLHHPSSQMHLTADAFQSAQVQASSGLKSKRRGRTAMGDANVGGGSVAPGAGPPPAPATATAAGHDNLWWTERVMCEFQVKYHTSTHKIPEIRVR